MTRALPSTRRAPVAALGVIAASSLVLAACGSGDGSPAGAASPEATAPTATLAAPATEDPTAEPDESQVTVAADPWPGEEPESTEVGASAPRLVVTHSAGVAVLDAMTLETVEDFALEGFTRVNDAGDGRHVMVSTTGGFAVLDTGTWGSPHGDHNHYYTAAPRLSDGIIWPAETPAHVVPHHGRVALFDDGTGRVTILDAADVADPDADVRELQTDDAHHGVAVELADGGVLITEGTEESRSTVRVLDADGEEVTRTDDCPGVHGEATAADDVVVVGCQDGMVIWDGTELAKVDSPDEYGRMGNQAGSEASSVVLGDYKSDPDAELERPTRVALVDTATRELQLVDLPASYTFRSLGRGDDGEALVLGTDGALHVIDPDSGDIVRSVPVVAEWEEPEEWQEPRPALFVHDGTAYVTEPATDTLHAVDYATGEVWASAELGVTPNEITGVSGDAEAGSPAHEGDHDDDHDHGDDHDHDDHDHDDEATAEPSDDA